MPDETEDLDPILALLSSADDPADASENGDAPTTDNGDTTGTAATPDAAADTTTPPEAAADDDTDAPTIDNGDTTGTAATPDAAADTTTPPDAAADDDGGTEDDLDPALRAALALFGRSTDVDEDSAAARAARDLFGGEDEEDVEEEEPLGRGRSVPAHLADAPTLVRERIEAEEEAEEVEAAEPPKKKRRISPYDRPGDWFVVHSYAGYENKVKANLESRIGSMNMEEEIFEVVIPMEDVIEFKAGKRVIVPRKVFPGYLLVRMYLNDDSWYVVRNTPGVTGFVGSGSKPTPLTRRDVENFLAFQEEKDEGVVAAKKPRPRLEWERGESVQIIDGPFAERTGPIEDIMVDTQKVRVLVDIFGRETPVELNFNQIAKL